MKTVCKLFGTLMKVLGVALSVLFVVYFWNLDQKVMAILYKIMNGVFDRKKADIRF